MVKINPIIGFYIPIIRIPSLKVGGFPSPIKRDFWPWHRWKFTIFFLMKRMFATTFFWWKLHYLPFYQLFISTITILWVFFFPAVSKPLFLSDGRFEAVPTQPGIRVKRTARVEFFDLWSGVELGKNCGAFNMHLWGFWMNFIILILFEKTVSS